MNARDYIHYGQQTLLSALEGISDDDAVNNDLCVTKKWNVRDVVGHLAAFEHVLEDVLSSQLSRVETPYLFRYIDMPGEEFNQFNYNERKYTPYKEVLAELNSAHEHVKMLAGKFTHEMMYETGTIPWYGKQYSIGDFIVYANYGHKREHSSQITQFKRHLADLHSKPSKT